jgi:hypothetical protein
VRLPIPGHLHNIAVQHVLTGLGTRQGAICSQHKFHTCGLAPVQQGPEKKKRKKDKGDKEQKAAAAAGAGAAGASEQDWDPTQHPWRPFDREKDLGAGLKGPANPQDLLNNAKALGTRFAGGQGSADRTFL